MMKENPFASDALFIVGAGRSGTTLLQMALNAHPELSVTGEFHYFDQICRLKEEIPSLKDDQSLDNFLGRVKHAYGFQFIRNVDSLLKESGLKLMQLPKKDRTYNRFFYELLEQHKKKKNASWIGEKTPENVRYLTELKALFPNARFIHIVRDPRAVVASSIKMPDNSRDVLIHAATWRSDVWHAIDFFQNNENCYTLRYEDLVTHTREELQKLVDFLGIAFDEKMLSYQSDAKNMLKDEPWKVGTTRKVYGSSITKWKQELSRDQASVVELLAGHFMNEFGYEYSRSLIVRLFALKIVPVEAMKYLAKRKEKKHLEEDTDVIYMKTDRVLTGLWKSLIPSV